MLTNIQRYDKIKILHVGLVNRLRRIAGSLHRKDNKSVGVFLRAVSEGFGLYIKSPFLKLWSELWKMKWIYHLKLWRFINN